LICALPIAEYYLRSEETFLVCLSTRPKLGTKLFAFYGRSCQVAAGWQQSALFWSLCMTSIGSTPHVVRAVVTAISYRRTHVSQRCIKMFSSRVDIITKAPRWLYLGNHHGISSVHTTNSWREHAWAILRLRSGRAACFHYLQVRLSDLGVPPSKCARPYPRSLHTTLGDILRVQTR
jgi:hypothetical protein